jgi:hypothetical protein
MTPVSIMTVSCWAYGGLLSEAELPVLRLRMEAGRQRQSARGTSRQTLPTGLVR